MTGVMLSNASIDVAFHDKHLKNKCSNIKDKIDTNIKESNKYDFTKDNLTKDYIKSFWVGLVDGDGSIQINHWRKQILQYRLVIKLKNDDSNIEMLNLLKTVIGGNVRLVKGFVIWVENDKNKIIEIIKIFNKYPLLTARKRCQLEFLHHCLKNNDVDNYLLNRDYKYSQMEKHTEDIIKLLNSYDIKNNNSYHHFKAWLSGFIEGEGCFSIRKNLSDSFSIGQNNEFYLMNFIKNYFEAENNLRILKKDTYYLVKSNNKPINYTSVNNNIYLINNIFYLWEIYNIKVIRNVINHCFNNPLLGQKKDSFKFFLTRKDYNS